MRESTNQEWLERSPMRQDAKNYDGSWTEYGNTVGVPIVNLAGTVWGGK